MSAINDFWLIATNWRNNIPNVAFNDIYVDDSGNIATVSGIEAMQQLVAQSLWLWYGEYDFNTTYGVTYRRLLGQRGVTNSLVQLQINNAIMSINNYIPQQFIPQYGIKKVVIQSYSMNRVSRMLSVTVDIYLNSGKLSQVIL